jgi:hypothetical protein
MIGRFIRWAARAGLTGLFILSLGVAGWSVLRITRDPLLRPLVERTAAEFAGALEREMAQVATPDAVAARLAALLAEDPRNWIAIEAVEEVAVGREIALPAELMATRAVAWDEDSGILTIAGGCLSCAWDAGNCSLSEALICHGPVALTPIGDLAGVARAGTAAVTGSEIDKVDFALSAIGLGATVAVAATGGTSYTLKVGASLLKMARKMSLLPPRLMALVADAARRGIRWDEALRWDSLTDPARLVNADIVAPIATVASDLGRIDNALDATRTLHVLRYIDGPDDSRRIANAAEVMGPRAVGTLEILGKSRFMRAALRISDEAAALAVGLSGLLLSLGLSGASLVQSLLTRTLRRTLRNAR